jgi:hypothetical protein
MIQTNNPNEFFVPSAKDINQAENHYQSMRRFLASQEFPTADRRIRKIIYEYKGQIREAEVGKEAKENQELVEMIFQLESINSYMICTESRGMNRIDLPIMTGNDEENKDHKVIDVINFD